MRISIIAVAAPILFAFALAGCSREPKPPTQCAAWGCHETASAPLAYTRAGGGARGMDLLSSGDLCTRHAGKVPFALVWRFFVFFALFPAMLGGYVLFRIMYVVDQYGPGLPKYVGEKHAQRIMFGVPVIVSVGWLAFYIARAW